MLCLLSCLLNYVLNGNAILLPPLLFQSYFLSIEVSTGHSNTLIIRPDFFSVHIKAFSHQRSSLYQRPEALPKINSVVTCS